MKIPRFVLVAFTAAVLLAGVGYGIYSEKFRQPSLENLHATLFNTPRPMPSFSLIDTHNQEFTDKNLQNKWSLIFFGFTRCGSICPTTLATLAQVYRDVANLPKAQKPRIIFITVDPEYDTPEKIQAYLNTFNTDFIGLTGKPEGLAAIRAQLGIMMMHHEDHANHNPADSIDHSGTILIINPKGEYAGIFSLPHSSKDISEDLYAFLRLS